MQYCPAKASKMSGIVLHIQIPRLASVYAGSTQASFVGDVLQGEPDPSKGVGA